jgi:hypothetical protein
MERVDDAIAAALKPPGEREAEPAAAGAQASPGRRAARSL